MSSPEEENVCPHCQGKQWAYEFKGDEMLAVPCVCLARQQLKSFLGPEISSAQPIRSDLYKPQLNPTTGKLEGDRTQENLYLKGSWAMVCRHLHWALWGKRRFSKSNFFFKIITDEKLLPVWLGNEAYNRRSAKVRDDIDTYNSLADLVSDPTLLIIRLGFLGWSNKAAAGVLLQTLGIRESLYKPTWIIEGPKVFGNGHYSYSDEVGTYIDENYDIIDLGGHTKADDSVNAILGLDSETDSDSSSAVETIALIPGEPAPSLPADEGGSAREPRFKDSQRKKKWRRSNGGGREGGGGAGGLGDMM